jgi:hypothetical protein
MDRLISGPKDGDIDTTYLVIAINVELDLTQTKTVIRTAGPLSTNNMLDHLLASKRL